MNGQKTKLPKWLEKRHSFLWNEFRDKTFTKEEAVQLLEEKYKDDEKSIGVFLSELKKAGILETFLDPIDSRKRRYKIKSKKEILKKMLSFNSKELTKEDIFSLLKKAADLIRTQVDYKFILILLFLKRISDKWELEYETSYKEAIEDGMSEEAAKKEAENKVYHDFDMPSEYLWENLRKDVNKLPERFSQALKELAERNPELKDVIDRTDFVQFTRNIENAEILRQLVELFSAQKFHNVSPDILGDAYEWVLGYFAPTKAKEGEIFTPREVIRLLVKILDPKPNQSIYDPCCGSGGMLIISYKHIREKYGSEEAKKLFLYGQESNQILQALCKMNLYIHDIRDADIQFGNTLLYPKFLEQDSFKRFDIAIANPPWNQDGYDEDVIKKGEFWKQRFKFGFTPKQSADWTWIQHMLASIKDDGKVGVVIDNGCLFRGGKEGAIREQISKKDLIESIILLPEKLFYNTGAPGALIIFNKVKTEERKNSILFINASNEYEKHKDVKKLNQLSDQNISKIAEAFNSFKEEPGFCGVKSLDEIEENEYNLNVTLYVIPETQIEEIDIEKEWKEIQKIGKKIKEIEENIENYLRDLV